MKLETNKAKKQRKNSGSKTKPVCGTLSYLAECRGLGQKPSSASSLAPPEDMKKIARKNPAAR